MLEDEKGRNMEESSEIPAATQKILKQCLRNPKAFPLLEPMTMP